jgi:nitroreductase
VLPETATTLNRVVDSASYLAEHLADVPVHVFPLVRRGSDDHVSVASAYGSIIPAAWSFMLAARSRGLGTSYTTLHLAFAHEAAAILNIDASRWVQTALLPLAYTLGTSFQPAERKTLSAVVSLDQFGTPPPF